MVFGITLDVFEISDGGPFACRLDVAQSAYMVEGSLQFAIDAVRNHQVFNFCNRPRGSGMGASISGDAPLLAVIVAAADGKGWNNQPGYQSHTGRSL